MPPFTEATTCTTSTTYATGGYTTYTPISTSYAAAPMYVSFENTEDKVKEYTEKVDKHIDELEEDIDYFNNKLDDHAGILKGHENCINDNYTINAEQDKKIKALEDTVEFLKNYTNYLEGRIMALEDKTNDKMS